MTERADAGGDMRPKVIGPSLILFGALAAVSGAACLYWRGAAAFTEALVGDVDLVLFVLPRIGAAVLIAGFLQTLVPKDVVARLLGERSGLLGMAIATIAGALTPGGPVTSFSLVVALATSGAGRGPLVAYITAWSLLGLQRILIWELPLLGPEFTLWRYAISAMLPILAGLIAQQLPLATGRPAAPDR